MGSFQFEVFGKCGGQHVEAGTHQLLLHVSKQNHVSSPRLHRLSGIGLRFPPVANNPLRYQN